jgi:hypothetical protein
VTGPEAEAGTEAGTDGMAATWAESWCVVVGTAS